MAKSDSKEPEVLSRLTRLAHLTTNSGESLKTYIQDSIRSNHSSPTTPGMAAIKTAEELGALLQQHRLEKRISQADLADLASISIGTLKNAEKGRNIGVDQMFALLRALGVSLYA